MQQCMIKDVCRASTIQWKKVRSPAPMPERVKKLGYDLAAIIKSTPTPVIIDIG